MRNLIAGALAIPVVALVIVGSIAHRIERRRPLAAAGIGLAVLLSAASLAADVIRPQPATGVPTTRESALSATEFATQIQTGESPDARIVVTFPSAMNAASVKAVMRIEPPTAVDLAWDLTGTLLTISPHVAWAPGTFHTVTVESGALAADGRPLDRRIRASFLTRPAVTASIAPTVVADGEATIATAFRVAFSGPIDESTLDVLVTPPVDGMIAPVADASATAPSFDFVPDDPLDPDTAYVVTLGPGTRDADGAPIEAAALTVRTTAAPAVIRFRPRNGWAAVNWSQKLSVRFTEPMEHATTEAAWTAVQGTTPLKGTFRWAEHDTVLVFDPAGVLGYSQKVTMTVGTEARSAAGLPLQAAASATFTTAARSVPPSSGGGSGGAGGSIGGSTWAAVESYYLKLMNCTRTGGSVTSTGACSSPGGRAVAPLWQDAGISAKVSRPYAKKLAVNGWCTHFSGGNPGDRLRAAGYTSYIWAENLGCRSGDPYAAVLASHLFFQSERSYGGGHYVNLMNAKYDRVGIGVWVSGGRVRLVVDFYHPL